MRVYANLREAHSEIERDLAKSPIIRSSRVQNLEVDARLHEAANYSYCVMEFPETLPELIALGEELGYIKEYHREQMRVWYESEESARLHWTTRTTEAWHPSLAEVAIEGGAPAYTYTDRLRGAVEVTAATLETSPDTRRAYWPIFVPEDAVRAHRQTRVPCSLGYGTSIRTIDGAPHLQVTYLQRSCDFRRFWLSDIWFAHRFQRAVMAELSGDLRAGPVSHIILSLHAFIEEGMEIY